MIKRENMLLIGLLILSAYMIGCAVTRTINVTKEFALPEPVKTKIVPVDATGKQTITKVIARDIQKEVSTSGFKIEKFKENDREYMRISKDDLEVTITHCSFDFLRDTYGLLEASWHPLSIHPQYAYHGPEGMTAYNSSTQAAYQPYWKVPFYTPVVEVYRDKDHIDILNEFKADMTKNIHIFQGQGITPSFGITKTEITERLEPLIGQPYVKEYFRQNYVFFVKIKNLSKEKIRLWPEQDAVIIDLAIDSQYPAYSASDMKKSISEFNDKWMKLFEKRNEPHVGISMASDLKDSERIKINYVAPNSPAFNSDIKVGDILKEFDGKKINSTQTVTQVMINKMSGDNVTAVIEREGKEIKKSLILSDRKNMKFPPPIKVLSGGNIYPSVEYNGFLVFKGSAISRNLDTGSMIRLILPMIGVKFDAADIPIQSIDLDFNFKLSYE